MSEAEQRGVDYLFKLRQTKNVKTLMLRAFSQRHWRDAGQGWQAREDTLRLDGWSRSRRAVILRRRLKERIAASRRDDDDDDDGQLRLGFAEIDTDAELHEYAVFVTSLDVEVLTIAQLYRDRADCENVFDELKNQWGWGGFTTSDLARCQLAAQTVALVYNWWNIFVRLAEPDKHLEAITSRPLLLAGIGKRVRHARQTTVRIASSHGRARRDASWRRPEHGHTTRRLKRQPQMTRQRRAAAFSRMISSAGGCKPQRATSVAPI